jgi:hypothetical protein
MTTKKKLMTVVLMSIGALWLVTGGKIIAGDGDAPLDRPLMVYSDATVVADWTQQSVDADGRPFVPWTMTALQLTTEGWCTNNGTGVMYLDTGAGVGSGVCTYLNGDTVEWDSFEELGTQHATITFTGGTGEFENAVGELTFDYTILTSELNEDGNPTKLTYTYWGAGNITY